MVSSKELIELDLKYSAHNYKPLDVVISKAKGIWVWDVEGKKYLDCLSAYSAVNQGHLHPKIVHALKDQADKLTLTSRAFRNDRMGPFLKHLCEVAEMESALPMNTGAEAVETGLKIARRWGYEVKGVEDNQAEIIVAEGNFHGRTITIVSFSTDPDAYTHFGPKTPGFKAIPYNNPEALEQAITPNTVAFLVEPIQGEAGVKIPSPGYLKKIREICTKHNILLILDEIQTGLGRTGKMFAYQHEGIKPDMLLVGKALGGGVFPVAAALTSWDIMKVITPGSHGSTFGGNPLACAVGDVALDVLVEEKLAERSAELGEYFLKGLHKIKEKTDLIKEIRGKGLFLAVEFKPEAGGARQFTQKLKENGILAKETHTHTIRFAPPLIITKEDIDWALKIIEEVLIS
ncbi:MAG: ornithine--oxo-acid transaminase [Promethearchaeota archaeon]